MTHLRLRRREADLEGKGTDSGREHSRLRFCVVIAREVESVIGMRCEIDEESRKPERDLPGPRSVHTQRLELSCCVEVSLSLWYLTSHDSLPIRPWSIFFTLVAHSLRVPSASRQPRVYSRGWGTPRRAPAVRRRSYAHQAIPAADGSGSGHGGAGAGGRGVALSLERRPASPRDRARRAHADARTPPQGTPRRSRSYIRSLKLAWHGTVFTIQHVDGCGGLATLCRTTPRRGGAAREPEPYDSRLRARTRSFSQTARALSRLASAPGAPRFHASPAQIWGSSWHTRASARAPSSPIDRSIVVRH